MAYLDRSAPGGAPPAKILIVDDHPLVREGLAARIGAQPDMVVCGEAVGVDEALSLVDVSDPALVIVDLGLKDGHGLDLIKKLRRRALHSKILVLSAYDESMYAERALRAGAQGFVSKQEAQSKVIDAIRAVLRGEHYLSPAMTERLIDQAVQAQSKPGGVESLTDRELQVFELIGCGKGTRAIAVELHLSIHTVESHRENIRHKLGIASGNELVQSAVQWVIETR